MKGGVMGDRIRRTAQYARTHKSRLASLTVLTVGLLARYVPGFPADEVSRAISVLVGA